MKKVSLKHTLDITFLCILIIFGISVYSTYTRAQQVTQNRIRVNNTSNVNDLLEKVLSSTINIETGTRGYTITGQDDYLAVYHDGNAKLDIWIDSLSEVTDKDSMQLKKLDKLWELIKRKKNISELVIKTRREMGMEAAVHIVKNGRGKEIMDSIRVSIAEYQNDAVRKLSENLKSAEKNVKARNTNFAIFTFITLMIICFAYIVLRRNTKQLLKDKIIQENLVDELAFQNQQLNDFASITSHNLRSPASNISSLVAAIEENATIDDYKMLFEMLKKVAQNLNESLNQLMEVLHIKRNKFIEKETLQFESVYQKTIDSLQGEILKSGAIFTHDFSAAPQIVYSKIYLDSIFHNLISNALKYRDPERKPEINVVTEFKNNHVYLHVRDNGLGIDMARHGNKIFGMNQIFHTHPEAKGIGLFMTKMQIESMEGSITVTSEVNVGTTFTVIFGN